MEATMNDASSFVQKKKKKKVVCTSCQSWVDSNMPGVAVEEIYNEKIASEEVAGKLQDSLDSFNPNAGITSLC